MPFSSDEELKGKTGIELLNLVRSNFASSFSWENIEAGNRALIENHAETIGMMLSNLTGFLGIVAIANKGHPADLRAEDVPGPPPVSVIEQCKTLLRLTVCEGFKEEFEARYEPWPELWQVIDNTLTGKHSDIEFIYQKVEDSLVPQYDQMAKKINNQ